MSKRADEGSCEKTASEQYVGTKAASEMLNLSQTTVSKLCREKKLPNAVQDDQGHPWHIPVSDIEEYKKQHSHKRIRKMNP